MKYSDVQYSRIKLSDPRNGRKAVLFFADSLTSPRQASRKILKCKFRRQKNMGWRWRRSGENGPVNA